MSSRHSNWSVFDSMKPFPPTPTPDSLMARIDAAISATELAHSSNFKSPPSDRQTHRLEIPAATPNLHDARVADEAYKAGCAAVAAGKFDSAVKSLRVAIASCPPEKTSALAKLQGLLSIAESQKEKLKLKQ